MNLVGPYILAIAILSVRPSVCHTHMGGSVKNSAS